MDAMPRTLNVVALGLLTAGTLALAQPPSTSSSAPQSQPAEAARSRFFSPRQWEMQREFEQRLNATPDPQRLRAWHDMLASEPHVAGTDGDRRVIESIVKAFREMGFEDVKVHEFWALLCEPIDARLEIIGEREEASRIEAHPPANGDAVKPQRRGVTALPITEDNLLNDPFVAHPGLSFGWNAYSGSGDVTAGVVYANYGTKEDFESLKANGVDCTGKIVLARYGGNFRGYKAKYAEEAGASGLIIYTDPDDTGYRKGITYPEGGWANDTCIQRGSIITFDQPGDPLTPGIAATQDAPRLDPEKIGLPHIPVQPVGYRAAAAIMTRMIGTPLPENLIKDWQGGLPCAYRLTGGDDLQLHLMVKQERKVKRTANVLATLPGSGDEGASDQRIYIGSHHDAWGFGAGDPTSGTILVMEAARSFASLARQGLRPQRSIVFCCWGAEEFGVIGSTEFCEQFGDDIATHAIAYINLDAATMGPNFGSSSDPLLKSVIEEAAQAVPQARDATGRTAFDTWKADKPAPSFGNLGGGSDHVGFYCHLGVPSCGLSGSGAPGNAYHSNYDNLAWYRHTVGEDYEPALMLTRIVNVIAARLANAEIAPVDVTRYATDLREHISNLKSRAEKRGVTLDLSQLTAAVDRLAAAAGGLDAVMRESMAADNSDHDAARRALAVKLAADPLWRAWTSHTPAGLPGREWFRNYYASSDPDSGYASWMLPALRRAIERNDAAEAATAISEYGRILDRLALLAGEMTASAGTTLAKDAVRSAKPAEPAQPGGR